MFYKKTNKLNMKQTAVEYLVDKLKSQGLLIGEPDNLVAFRQAKAMEKQQIINARVYGMCAGIDIGDNPIVENLMESHEKYYKETFNKEELPKTQIDWSGFPKSTQEQVGFNEPNIIDEWLDKNGSPEIAKQVEEEAKELCGETLEEAVEFWANEASWCCPVSFESGAKWQQERSYSEEEVFTICGKFATFIQNKRPSYKKQLEWFGQFKKK